MVILSLLTLLRLMLPFGSSLPQGGRIEQRADAQCHGQTGTPCYVLDRGYNGEIDYKRGTCKGEKCQYTEIPKGCESKLKHRQSPSGKQVGCAFTCYEDGQTKFNYFLPGTKCRHAVAPGKYVDGTCFKEEPSGEVHCSDIPPPMAC
ncbi:uncharacterized protein [Dermacentor albipictus]|uniref:uncharacterized protein n=1 Tax=Dermacentor albipictus TaxID=60249 RepID=UPI0038FD2708